MSALNQASLDSTVKRWSINSDTLELIETISTINSPVKNMVITNDRTFIIIGK